MKTIFTFANKTIIAHESEILEFENIGKNRIKSMKMEPQVLTRPRLDAVGEVLAVSKCYHLWLMFQRFCSFESFNPLSSKVNPVVRLLSLTNAHTLFINF